MHTEVRVGDYEGEILDLVKQYSDDFFHVPAGREDIHKYGLSIKENGDSYLMMVSNSTYEPKKDEDVPYNMMITVMGPQEQRALEILEEFGEKVDIEIRNAPQSLVEFYDEMSHRFG